MRLFDRWRARTPGTTVLTAHHGPSRPELVADDPVDAEHADAVQEHLARLTAPAGSDPQALTTAEFEAALTSRLVAEDSLPPGPRFHYVPPFLPHVAEVLTLDLPTAVVTLPHDRLLARRRHLPSLLGLARQNLTRLLETATVEVAAVPGSRHSCLVLAGDSPYTASFARFLADAVARWAPRTDTSNGLVLALPDRHTIVLQSCATPAAVREALELVPAVAARTYDAGAGPLTPYVYHWYHREVTCLTQAGPDGTLTVSSTPLLDGILAARRRRTD